jgi:prepilin-type N-terminal cleavage/methylation domain-containing protein
VDPLLTRHADLRLVRSFRRGFAEERGFSLIEVVIAAVIFLLVATAMTGVMTSAIASHTVSRERTKGVQVAQDQLERVSNLAYSNVGVSGGYPSGVIPAAGWSVPAGYAVSFSVIYVNDPGPTSSRAVANYKRVTVVVSRASDGSRRTSRRRRGHSTAESTPPT